MMKSSELRRLIFNPFYVSVVLHHFLSGVKSTNKDGIKTELIYMVLPFVYDEEVCKELSKRKRTSKLSQFIGKEYCENLISQINTRIRDFKPVTKEGVIILSHTNKLDIGEFLNIEHTLNYSLEKSDEDLRKIFKASYHLGVMLAKERYLTVFSKLKITEL